jgi:putative ABC transport system ATP-binding protein
MTDPVVEAMDVVKVLGHGASQVTALNRINLNVRSGELVLLMGPSGCGKTTLLSVLGCMLSPTHGIVRLLGHSTSRLGPERLAQLRRQHIGFIFQSYHLFPMLSALDNVRLALDVRGDTSKAAVDKAKTALHIVHLERKAALYPEELSTGEQQRVAIARAIVGGALVLFADEPTAALDSANGHDIMTVLWRMAKDFGRGVLVVTHDPRTLSFADRIVHMEDGRIVRELRNPQHTRHVHIELPQGRSD